MATEYAAPPDEPRAKLKDTWVIVKDFLRDQGLEKLHLQSYNNFINVEMPKILEANRRVTSDADSSWYLEYDKVRVGLPQIEDGLGQTHISSPNECRLRNLTYSAPILVDIRYIQCGQEHKKHDVMIGKIPVMLRSQLCVLHGKTEEELVKLRECPLDPGGYFIAKGGEKVVLMQEQMMKNRTVCEYNTKKELTCFVVSFSHDHKTRTTVAKRHGCYYVRFSMFKEDIPVLVIFAAMGIHYLDMALGWIGREHFVLEKFTLSVDEFLCLGISKKEEALQYLAVRLKTGITSWGGYKRPKTAEVTQILVGTLLSHVPVANGCFDDKAAFLSYMVRRCILAEKDPKLLDDRDHFGVKRLQLAGNILSLIFEDVIKSLNTELKTRADKHLRVRARTGVFDPTSFIRVDKVTHGFNYFLDTGNLNIRRFKVNRVGVAQVLVRLSFVSAVGMMSRLQSQFEKSRKVSGPRSIQASQYGIVCPSDTPEGEGCGLTKNLALLCNLTDDAPEDHVRKLLTYVSTKSAQEICGTAWKYPKGSVYTVFVNGSIFGYTKDVQCAGLIRQARRNGNIDKFISAAVSDLHSTITFSTDSGRMCRPYFVVENGRVLMEQQYVDAVRDGLLSFDDLVNAGAIEYLDVNELNDSLIALDEDEVTAETTHMEIAPFSILGVVAGTIPYPHHNQSPRNTYQCAMGKQAIGAIALNQTNRIDTVLQCSWNPQRPLVQSKIYSINNCDRLPAGQNAIVAMVSYSSYDIEDAIILNKASLERGYQRATVFRKQQTMVKTTSSGERETLFGPRVDPKTGIIKYDETKLDNDGMIGVGHEIERGDILINKYVPVGIPQPTELTVQGGLNRAIPVDKPDPVKFHEPNKCHIDKVMISQFEREQLIKVRTSQTRTPEIGDKFSSRHGQKGVCGLIVPEEDMPFTLQGIRPDAIMNPHGIPSRMTVGLLRELMGSKAGSLIGKVFDGSAFCSDNLAEISKILEENGFDRSGKEILIDGVTGKLLEAYIFIGPFYYQRLKHMVMDKIHARAKGPRQTLTRQPTEGRAHDGGLRMGEMERDCMIAHGVSSLLNERLMLASDECEVLVCSECGLFVWKEECTTCRVSGKISAVRMPYACKLLFQELISMNIAPRMTVSQIVK